MAHRQKTQFEEAGLCMLENLAGHTACHKAVLQMVVAATEDTHKVQPGVEKDSFAALAGDSFAAADHKLGPVLVVLFDQYLLFGRDAALPQLSLHR
jgi:hypothetical protein